MVEDSSSGLAVIRRRTELGSWGRAATWCWELKSDVATLIAAVLTDGSATQRQINAPQVEMQGLHKEYVSGVGVGNVGGVGSVLWLKQADTRL